jgi:hypothetical protein
MLGEEEGLPVEHTDGSSGRQSDRCGWAVSSGDGGDLNSDESEFYEAPDAFYRTEEGRETVLWRRNGRRRVELFNASVSGIGEERATPVSEGESSTQGSSYFPRVGATRGCIGVAVCSV